MEMFLIRTVVAGFVIGVVSEVAHLSPRIGTVLLTLPLVSILAFVMM